MRTMVWRMTISTKNIVIGVRTLKLDFQVATMFTVLKQVEDSDNWKKSDGSDNDGGVADSAYDDYTDQRQCYWGRFRKQCVYITRQVSIIIIIFFFSSSSSYSSSYYVSPTATMVFYVATCAIAVVGFLANGYVFLALIFSKNSRKNNVNAFITHQTVLDLTACVFLFIGLVVKPKGMNDSLALFICLFFRSYAMSLTAGSALVCGLVIITIERYVKICLLYTSPSPRD